MKIALINGSPKLNKSTSKRILQELKEFLNTDNTLLLEYNFRTPQLSKEYLEQLTECDVLVFAFPLYVDGIPSHLLNCLIQLEDNLKNINKKDIVIYSIVNCGFYEGNQNKLAIEIMENWCEKAGLEWGQGIGIGAGGMLLSMEKLSSGHGPRKKLDKAFKDITKNIMIMNSGENIFITPNFPRFAYKLAGEMGWRRVIKANRLKRKDLFIRK